MLETYVKKHSRGWISWISKIHIWYTCIIQNWDSLRRIFEKIHCSANQSPRATQRDSNAQHYSRHHSDHFPANNTPLTTKMKFSLLPFALAACMVCYVVDWSWIYLLIVANCPSLPPPPPRLHWSVLKIKSSNLAPSSSKPCRFVCRIICWFVAKIVFSNPLSLKTPRRLHARMKRLSTAPLPIAALSASVRPRPPWPVSILTLTKPKSVTPNAPAKIPQDSWMLMITTASGTQQMRRRDAASSEISQKTVLVRLAMLRAAPVRYKFLLLLSWRLLWRLLESLPLSWLCKKCLIDAWIGKTSHFMDRRRW